MKNRLTDLNDALFTQLERLSDDMTPEAMSGEIKRAEAVVAVADAIVVNARLQLDACKLVAEHGDRFSRNLPMIAPTSGEAKA